MILLIPPVYQNVGKLIEETLKRNGLTKAEEIDPKAGCRRFKLS